MIVVVASGLMSGADMQIAGNHSSDHVLQWFTDQTGAALPRPWFVSVPMYVFKLLALAWALWLAFALVAWLRWGFAAFGEGGLWARRRRTPVVATEPVKTAAVALDRERVEEAPEKPKETP